MQAKSLPLHSPQPADDFRRALGQFATGVTIVTTRAADGTPVGMTANSFSSVSLHPPLVLWSLSHSAASHDIFRNCARYLIHVLAADQLDLAKRFATRGSDKFGAARWADNDAGLPLLEGCVAWFECANRAQYDEGDHVILVGRVDAFEIGARAKDVCPLIFHNSRYVTELHEAPLPQALKRALRD